MLCSLLERCLVRHRIMMVDKPAKCHRKTDRLNPAFSSIVTVIVSYSFVTQCSVILCLPYRRCLHIFEELVLIKMLMLQLLCLCYEYSAFSVCIAQIITA